MDEQAIRFCKEMRALKAAAPKRPIAPGALFHLVLNRPELNARMETYSPRPLPLHPDLPGTKTSYEIVEALQAGESYHSQVWLAKPLGPHSDSDTLLVFKFIVASHLPQQDEVPRASYRSLEQVATNQHEPFEKLWFLQGSFLPWFYGVHEVTTPWGEPGKLFVMEYIPTTFRAFTESESQAKMSVEAYANLFKKTLRILDIAHEASITHGDISLDNLLVDTTTSTPTFDDPGSIPRLVFIDWRNEAKDDPRGAEAMTYFFIERDIRLLFRIFVGALAIEARQEEDYMNFIKRMYKDDEVSQRLIEMTVLGGQPEVYLFE
ncbi:hypothetical protein VNI00_000664 [Paramarasmius palmivorus]|uniref:Non-specific serine/threonine protein kinase n=1 Tax=Paramarasmius palmivorus TaxID=297713 RepID=A0AAW0E623_9AGAR